MRMRSFEIPINAAATYSILIQYTVIIIMYCVVGGNRYHVQLRACVYVCVYSECVINITISWDTIG